jgi:hypothetical protein
LFAIGLGDDAIAVFKSDNNATTTNISNSALIDTFSRGIFINGAGTYEAPGTSILQSWTTIGSTTIVSSVGSVTLTRSGYCIELVPGQPPPPPDQDCVALANWAGDTLSP